ncbi:C-type lectin domain-containing protein [Caenorhabditis elegans]|uniref:C-type lectin domain-containing protein n=1 Tax=Caenorhabditis elegans TaxID=6239 RepID=G5EBG4_CAEEL|nr:C-type lectin domain-containing protein [Caenorhabditis elegans]NP_503676.1 C-type lectin domain-containing protein [Caenorhabditis elegans]CCD62312.1 C-type lectin domain-containing protein [Caenorhabditis elegans]CCD64366.1 C-type lectin domain-containing protein [Caenorhabditis elegans]|eukprot:NP_503650.1 C-type LECtin [Caenorhabditis elegans]
MFRLVVALSILQLVAGQCAHYEDKLIGDLCYSFYTETRNFDGAERACSGNNQNLAVLHNTLQTNFLASIVRSQTGATKFWIGLSRATPSSRFQWDDGTTMYWSNFNMNHAKDNNYVAEHTTDGKWQTIGKHHELPFVCSYDPKNFTPIPSGSGSTPDFTNGPASGATDEPISDATGAYSTDLPFSDSPTGASDLPFFGSSGATDFPVSGGPSDSPIYPASGATDEPISDATGVASSDGPLAYSTDLPFSDSPTGASDMPFFGTSDYPVSGGPFGTPDFPVSDGPSGSSDYPVSAGF